MTRVMLSKIIMPLSVLRIVKAWKTVSLPRIAQEMEDCINAVLGNDFE